MLMNDKIVTMYILCIHNIHFSFRLFLGYTVGEFFSNCHKSQKGFPVYIFLIIEKTGHTQFKPVVQKINCISFEFCIYLLTLKLCY